MKKQDPYFEEMENLSPPVQPTTFSPPVQPTTFQDPFILEVDETIHRIQEELIDSDDEVNEDEEDGFNIEIRSPGVYTASLKGDKPRLRRILLRYFENGFDHIDGISFISNLVIFSSRER